MDMPMPKLRDGGKANLDELLQQKIRENTVPSIFWAVTNADGAIYENQAGNVITSDASSREVNRDSTLEIYSMTKLIVCVAVLQLVDQGILELDDQNIVYEKLPELGTQMVFEGYDELDKAILVPQTSRITIRMLMNHTSGTTTAHRNGSLLHKWYLAQPNPPPGGLMTGASIQSIVCPLLFQPGSSFQYSSGTDWLGVLITRITGLSLENYLRKHIFERVDGGMPDTTFYPRPDIVARKIAIYQRLPEGSLSSWGGFSGGRAETVEDVSKTFLAGSGGLFGTTKDYLAFLRALLQCDPRHASPESAPLLSARSYELLFEPSLNTTQKGKAAELMASLNICSPKPTANNVDHSVGFPLNLVDSEHGRKAMSGGWYGMAKTQYWIDPTTGIAAVCNTQIISQDPDPWNKIYTDFERAVYDNISE